MPRQIKQWSFVVILLLILSACGTPAAVRHFEYYPTGEFRLAEMAMGGSRERIELRTERYQSGAISVEEFAVGSSRVRLTFYSDGQLKTEERFSDGRTTFGRYYSEGGALERTTGELPRRPAWMRGSQAQSQ